MKRRLTKANETSMLERARHGAEHCRRLLSSNPESWPRRAEYQQQLRDLETAIVELEKETRN